MAVLRTLVVLAALAALSPVTAAAPKDEVVGARWKVIVLVDGMEAEKHYIRCTTDYKVMFLDTQLGTYTQGKEKAVLKMTKGALKGEITITKVERTLWSGTWTKEDGTKHKVHFHLVKD